MAKSEALDHNQSALMKLTRGPSITISARVKKEGVITVVIEISAAHLDRRIAIQGTRSKAFYNAYQRLHPDATAIRRLRHF